MRAMLALVAVSILLPLLAAAQSPPAFPWEGNATALVFTNAWSKEPVAGACISLEIAYDGGAFSTLLTTQGDGTALLYAVLPEPTGAATASAEARCEGMEMEYVSSPVALSLSSTQAQEIPLIPVGRVEGNVTSSNGTAVPAEIEFSCAPPMDGIANAHADAGGAFTAILPAGNCTATASFEGESGSAAILVTRGRVSSASIQLAERGAISRLAEDTSAYIVLALLAIFGGAIIYWKEKGKKKGGRAKSAALLLLLAASVASASPLSINRTDSTHTYDMQALLGYVPNAREAVITVSSGSIDGCQGRTIIEVSDDGANYATLATIATVSPIAASATLQSPGPRRYYRLRNGECWLASSQITVHEHPDLGITGISLRSEDGTGIPRNQVPITVVATISNKGGALNSSRISSAMVHFYQDSHTEGQKIGEVRIPSDSPAFGEKGSGEAHVAWAPPSTGMHTIYAEVSILPAEEDAEQSNNIASRGFYVEPAPTDQRSSMLEVVSAPQAVKAGAHSSLLISAKYTDILTRQPILGASCSASAERVFPGQEPMAEKGTSYELTADATGLGVGVYRLEVECSKPGHAPANASYYLPVNSPEGQQAILAVQPSGSHLAEIPLEKAGLGPIQRLKIRLERSGPESIGVTSRSVVVNGFPAASFSTDGAQHDGRFWLEGSASYAEWVFNKDALASDALAISISVPVLLNGAPAGSTAASISAIPIQSFCSRRPAQVSILPQAQVGEVGTPLYYEVLLNNTEDAECGTTPFIASITDPRQGWKYEFSSTIVPVPAGETNVTFLSVTPLPGEQPGEYFFTVGVSQVPESAQDAPASSHAKASYSVSSPRLFAGLDAGVSGNGSAEAVPGSRLEFFASYYNIDKKQIGSCRIFSPLVSTKGVAMQPAGEKAALSVDTSRASPGTYPYLITCEMDGHKSLSHTGNATILPPKGALRLPSISAFPAAQSAAQGSTISFIVSVKSNSECAGHETILLGAEFPEGWNARLGMDALSVPCGGEKSASLAITVPQGIADGVSLGSVSASIAGAPEYSSAAVLSIASIRGAAPTLFSCLLGNARESEANFLLSGDMCRNWNQWHTYEAGAGNGTQLHASGIVEFIGCEKPVSLEFGDDPSSFTLAAKAMPDAKGGFSMSFPANGSRFVRIGSECLLGASSLAFAKPSQAGPEFIVTSAEFPGALVAGQRATAKAKVFNLGTSTYSQYSVSISLRDAYGLANTAGVGQVYSHASGQEIEVELGFTPQEEGTFELVFTADSARDIIEVNESNNQFVVPGATVSPAFPSVITTHLEPGWNLVPFLFGADAESNCAGNANLLLSDGSIARLGPSEIGFGSEEEAASFLEAHGTSGAPKDMRALGGAWHYSSEKCEIAYSAQAAASLSREAASHLPVPQGGAIVAILPWMAENTVQNIMGSCSPAVAYAWNPGSQRWEVLSGTIAPEMVGGAFAFYAERECRLG